MAVLSSLALFVTCVVKCGVIVDDVVEGMNVKGNSIVDGSIECGVVVAASNVDCSIVKAISIDSWRRHHHQHVWGRQCRLHCCCCHREALLIVAYLVVVVGNKQILVLCICLSQFC